MKRIHSMSLVAGISTLALGLSMPASVSASGPNDFGCYDSSIGCDSWGFNGSCRYNASDNACTCTGEYPLDGGTWERGTYDCQMPIVN